MFASVHVRSVIVLMVLVFVTLVNIVDVPRLVGVVAVGVAFVDIVIMRLRMMFVVVAFVDIVIMRLRMMFVVVAFVDIVDVPRLVPMMFVGIALVNIVLLHYHRLRLLTSRSILSASVPIADTCFVYQYNLYFDTAQE